MTFLGWLLIVAFMVILTALALPLGHYMAKVYSGERVLLEPVLGGPERLLYRVMRVDATKGQDWKAYARSLIVFSLAGWLLLYVILRTQTLWNFTGLNPEHFHSGTWDVTFNTTSSFLDEHELAVLRRRDDDELLQPDGRAHRPELPLRRGRDRRRGRADPRDHRRAAARASATSGRTSCARSCTCCCRSRSWSRWCWCSRGRSRTSRTTCALATIAASQSIAMGPVASQEAIKELGTNGGGFFNINSAHPFENPTGFSNFVEMLAVLSIPAALDVHVRADDGQSPAGLRDLRDDDDHVPRRGGRRLHRRGPRLARSARRRLAHAA